MSVSKIALDKQLEYVNDRINKQAQEGAKLTDIRNLVQEINKKGLTSNPYTGTTCYHKYLLMTL
jgi:hypothetical protein